MGLRSNLAPYHWFSDFWPWWVAIFWLAGYELYIFIARNWLHVPGLPPNMIVLSQMVWTAFRVYPWSGWIVAIVLCVLLFHFYVTPETPFPLPLFLLGLTIVIVLALRSWGFLV